jgi:secretion/DNA translocation related TadE-like protein
MRKEQSEPRTPPSQAATRNAVHAEQQSAAIPRAATEQGSKGASRMTGGNQRSAANQPPGSDQGSAIQSPGSERGSATVLATGIAAALLVSAVAFTALGQAGAARHRAQGAADAAALAGAARVLFGEGEACAAARAMVERSDAEFQGCEVSELEVTVHVNETPNGLPAAFGPARAVSRAGPVAVE